MMFKAFLFVLLVLAPVHDPLWAKEGRVSGAADQPAVVVPATQEVPVAVVAPAPEAAVAPEAAPVASPDVVAPIAAVDVEAPAVPAAAEKDVVADPDVKEAVPIPQTDVQAAEQTVQAFNAFEDGKWYLGAILLLGVGIYIGRRFFSKKPVAEKPADK